MHAAQDEQHRMVACNMAKRLAYWHPYHFAFCVHGNRGPSLGQEGH
jgi:hypothetical protein